MYPMVKKRSVSLTAEKQVGEKKRKIMLDVDPISIELPSEIWRHVFSYLDLQDLTRWISWRTNILTFTIFRLQFVSKLFYKNAFKNITTFNLSAVPELKRHLTKEKMDQIFFRLSNFCAKGINTDISSFVLTHSIAENIHFEHISRLASLTHVNLAMSSHISDGVLPYLATLTNLKELVLNNILINGNGLENLKHFQHLKYLNVRSHGDVLDALPLIPNLEELFLTHSISPSKLKNFGKLAALTNLKALSIPPKFNYDQLQVIGELTTLKALKLQTGIFENLEPLKNLTNLENLSLTSCKFFKNNNSQHFHTMEHLTRLEIIMCPSLKSEGMQRFSELPNLKCLQLSYLTLQPFSFVTSFTNLNNLSLVGFQLSDEDVNSLLSVQSLVNIQLFKCNSLHDRTLQNLIMNDVDKKVVCM